MSLFNYGNVFIQTAGAHPNIEFNAIPDPTAAATSIAASDRFIQFSAFIVFLLFGFWFNRLDISAFLSGSQ